MIGWNQNKVSIVQRIHYHFIKHHTENGEVLSCLAVLKTKQCRTETHCVFLLTQKESKESNYVKSGMFYFTAVPVRSLLSTVLS